MMLKLVKNILLHVFLLNKKHYDGQLSFYERLEENVLGLPRDDVLIDVFVMEIPQKLKNFYIRHILCNLNADYFRDFFLNVYIIIGILIFFIGCESFSYLMLIPLFYMIICIVLNLFVTFNELVHIKKRLEDIYDHIISTIID